MTETSGPIRVLHVGPDAAAPTAVSLERTSDRLVVATAADRREALARLAESAEPFDCVVVDLPGTDGLEFLDALGDAHDDLPVLLRTGDDDVAVEAVDRGATDVVREPPDGGTTLLANRIENAVDRRRTAGRVATLDRTVRLVRAVDRVRSRAETRAELERGVCEAVVDDGGYGGAWIGAYDPETGAVDPRATAGMGDPVLDDTGVETGAVGAADPDCGPVGRALRTREPVVVEAVSEAGELPCHEVALDRGDPTGVVVPLVGDGAPYGALVVYVERTGTVDDERDVLAELGTGVVDTIGRIEADASAARYERLVDHLPVGVCRIAGRPTGDVVDANPALADVLGADTADALTGHAAADFYLDPDDREALCRRLRTEGVVRDERLRLRTLDGGRIQASITAIRTETGDRASVDAIVRDVTERERRERRRHQFRSAVEHAGHVVLITDTDGTITYVNGAFESVTGYAEAEAIGRRPSMLQSGEHDEAFYSDLWETISSGEVWQGEVVNERKDGTQYVIDQTVAPITDDDGENVGFVAVNRDVTARKERELNLTFLKRAIDQAGIGIGTYGADGYATYVNERLAELFGTDRDDLRSQHMATLGSDLDHDRFAEYWASFADGERRIYETRIERVDTGEVVPAEVVTSRVTIDGVPYQVNTVRDATDHKRRKRDVERFRSAVEHAGHSVLITDADGRIEYVNDSFEAVSGYSAAEAIGRTPAILQSGEHDEAFYSDLWETISSGEVWQGEVVNERKDGTQYVIDQTVAPITDDDGENVGFVAVNRDVTDLKEYERELEAQNDRLKRYGETVAHDLRNPLASLEADLRHFEATVDASEGTVDAGAVRTLCDDVESSIDRMTRLIDDLLEMAKQGQRVLDPETVSLAAVARETWTQLDADSADLSVEDATVAADPDRLQELLANLFRNSIEHAGEDVHVRVRPLDFDVGFAVEDDGPGIPPDERETVFDRGFTTAADGTGFGLAIVERIADAHGWSVTVADGERGGARFEFRVDREA